MSDRQSATSSAPRRAIPWGTIVPAAGFLIVLAVLALLWARHSQAQRVEIAARQQANVQAGLPRDYPSEVVPVYPGVTLVKAERGDTESTTGEPMDKWYVHATSKDEPKKLFDYYNDLMLKGGLHQTTYMSIPTGYGVNFANERYDIQFVIETRSGEADTQLEITVNRLRN
jgi:hypothetical protein